MSGAAALWTDEPCPPDVEALLPALCQLRTGHLGRGEVVDCGGLAQVLFAGAGQHLPLPETYPPEWWKTDPRRAVRHMRFVARWPLARPPYRPLALMLFNLSAPHDPRGPGQHFVVHLGRGRVIHARGKGVVIEQLPERPPLLREVFAPPNLPAASWPPCRSSFRSSLAP